MFVESLSVTRSKQVRQRLCVCVQAYMVLLLWERSNWLTVSSIVYLDTLKSYHREESHHYFLLPSTGQSRHYDLQGM